MNENLINKIITYNYNNFGNEFGDALVDLQKENARLKDKNDKAIEYLYKHSQYNDRDGVHYIKEDEYCVDYLLDILK